MYIRIKTIEDLNSHIHKLPTYVVEDINKRMTDWLSSGRTLEDAYIKQQFRYAEAWLNNK